MDDKYLKQTRFKHAGYFLFFLGKELIWREAYSISVKDLTLAVGGLKA